jgi:hypothetical protein
MAFVFTEAFTFNQLTGRQLFVDHILNWRSASAIAADLVANR